MKTLSLLPHRYKKVGWYLLGISILLWVLATIFYDGNVPWLNMKFFTIVNTPLFKDPTYFNLSEVNLTATLLGISFICGALLVIFSKEKIEDEFIMHLRLQSFLWAVLINYAILLALFLFVFGMAFLYVMVYIMFSTLVIYMVRFNYLLIKSSK